MVSLSREFLWSRVLLKVALAGRAAVDVADVRYLEKSYGARGAGSSGLSL